MKIVGITGRSGCGKSTVTRFVAGCGYPFCDADEVAREVLQPGSPCLVKIRAAFGEDLILPDGTLQRRLLADRAFATPQGTKTLTDITWPEIIRRIEAKIKAARNAGRALFFVDGAVIVDTPFQSRCDILVVVTTPLETSVRRICARDGIAPEMAERRLQAQTPETTLRDAADYVLENDGTEQELQNKTRILMQQLEKEADETEK